MRWPLYILLVYLAIALRAACVHWLGLGQAAPDFALLVVVFLALHAPPREALLGAFFAGLMVDLLQGPGIGTHAFSFGLAGAIVFQIRLALYRDHPLTHAVMGLLAGVIVLGFRLIRDWITGDHPTPSSTLLIAVALTAAVAPLVIGPLRRSRKTLKIRAGEVD